MLALHLLFEGGATAAQKGHGRRVPTLAEAMIAQVPKVVATLSTAELDVRALASYGKIAQRRAERIVGGPSE